jgi:hypothetical protein
MSSRVEKSQIRGYMKSQLLVQMQVTDKATGEQGSHQPSWPGTWHGGPSPHGRSTLLRGSPVSVGNRSPLHHVVEKAASAGVKPPESEVTSSAMWDTLFLLLLAGHEGSTKEEMA